MTDERPDRPCARPECTSVISGSAHGQRRYCSDACQQLNWQNRRCRAKTPRFCPCGAAIGKWRKLCPICREAGRIARWRENYSDPVWRAQKLASKRTAGYRQQQNEKVRAKFTKLQNEAAAYRRIMAVLEADA